MRLLETRRFKAALPKLILGLRSLIHTQQVPVSIPDVIFLLSRQLVLTFMKELFLISAGHVSQHGGADEAPISCTSRAHPPPVKLFRQNIQAVCTYPRDLRQTLIKEPFILVHR